MKLRSGDPEKPDAAGLRVGSERLNGPVGLAILRGFIVMRPNLMSMDKRKTAAAWLSVGSNTVLIAGKVVVGLMIGSVSILSEAIHSGVDLLAAWIALFAVKKSGEPADEDHPFGHGKFENISGTIEALLIFIAAGWIIWEAVKKLIHPHTLEEPFWGAGVMLVSAVVNIGVSHRLFKVGRQTSSAALLADAWHLRTDVYTSAGVMVGMVVIWMGGIFAPAIDLRWVDPVGAILVAILILRAAYELTRESARDLLDMSLPETEQAWLKVVIEKSSPHVNGYHGFRTRKSGPYRFVEFHLIVDPEMSVRDSHRITDEITHGIEGRFPSTTVTIHIEPCDRPCEPRCLDGCLLPPAEREKRG